ncbi:MAG TPA: acyl-CoA dehydrogenase, partial [Planctomycetota bacterium]|nr:acyl-CoA dehydrogenase [Planctomycetota bacterium]
TAAVLGWWYASGVESPNAFTVYVFGAGALALVFGLPPLRRALVTSWLIKLMGKILPRMSDTEREALEAGTVWWDRELFSGRPDWKQLLDFRCAPLSAAERAFLAGPVARLCAMLDDHQVTKDGDLPPDVWQFIKDEGFMGMIIPVEHGGLGFSAAAQSAIIARLASRCVTASVTVMVPNSLGPAELLLHYGTEEQKQHYLPRLAKGIDVPAFALTEPGAGSDAGSLTSKGIVARGEWQGKQVLGMRLTWDKRYITLAPVATVLGLAFKLYDPDGLLGDKPDLGITCALIPSDMPGVEHSRRHDPLGIPFMNGPTTGEDVFVPLDFIIGGAANAGKGWRMLMQSLAAGRGISLPALSTGASQLATRLVGAYASVREQFGMAIGKFEGIEARLARIGGLTYLIDGARRLTLGALDAGEKPSVVTAIMKAYTTEAMRVTVNDAMDVVAGAGICRGPRNVLAHAYQSIPIGITVEGANILTRSMIVFGQGAIRCHPYVQDAMAAEAAGDVPRFDRAFFGHVGLVFTNGSRALVHGLTGSLLAGSPVSGAAAPYFKQLTRCAAIYGLLADVAMGTLGGELKRKENLSGRLADGLAYLYLASGAIKRFVDDGQPERDRAAFRWALEHALFEFHTAMNGLLDNLPLRIVAWKLRWVCYPFGMRFKQPSDRLGARLARGLVEGGPLREALSELVYVPQGDEPGLARVEAALTAVVAALPVRAKLKAAQRAKKLPRKLEFEALVAQAREAGVLDASEVELVRKADEARKAAVLVDAFEPQHEAAGVW